MARRVLVVGAMYVCAILAVVGVSVLLARTSRASEDEDAREVHDVIHVSGKAAAEGDVRETTLHKAHLQGAEPVPCKKCHEFAADDFTPPDRERCLGCHQERKAALHAAIAAINDEDVAQCRRCHDFLDDRPTKEGAWKCRECHEKPHPEQLPMTGAPAETCGRCHSPHGDQAQAPTACIGCHEEKVTRHRVSDDPTKACLACHRQHDDAANAKGRCATCHADTKPLVPVTATFANGHDACTGCHEPHLFSRKSVVACNSCHENQKALAADRVDAHRNCRSCHEQHAVKAASGQSCRRCHDKFTPAHPKSDQGDHCLGCHPAHPGTRQVVRTCSSCHNQARDDRAFHRGAKCSDCHREHGFKLTAQQSLCLGCHAGRVGPRQPITVSTGHGDCGKCHGGTAHALGAPPSCATCHKEQGATAPKGHAQCMNCHDQHTGNLKRKAATCTSCHTDRKGGIHGGIKGGCVNCHRQHGPGGVPQPPACTTCHKAGSLPGLHSVNKHSTCTSCHSSHGPKVPTVAKCRSCHEDKKDHEPTATSCIGCHLFSRGEP